jgi:hypothetical protein
MFKRTKLSPIILLFIRAKRHLNALNNDYTNMASHRVALTQRVNRLNDRIGK